MRFLLVNTNNAVRKIFNITAKKAAIQLDAVSSISQIPLKEDYNCIFIDDGVLNTGDISKFKNKMITTKFCIILSKDSPLVSGFDSYIRKPFLPTDIYEVMKKEKSNDMSVSSSSYSADEGATVDTSVNANIDLNEFSDSEDEFLSGIKDSGQEINFDLDIPPTRDDLGVDSAKSDFEIPATGGFVDNDFRDIDLDSSAESSTQNAESNAESNENTDDFEINFTLDSAELSEGDTKSIDSTELNIKATQDIDLDIKADISLDSAPKTAPKKVDILEEAEAQINNIKALADKGGNFFNSSNDTHDIDFSAVMALQDELLKEEESKNKKKLIGGDISRKKEPTKQEPKVAESSAKNAESSASVAEKKPEKKPNVEKDIKQDFAEFESKTDSALKDSAVEKELDSADIMSAFELDSAELEKALDSAPEKEPIKKPAKDFAKESAKENIAPLGDDLQNFPHEQVPKAQASDSDFTSGLDVDLDALDSISSFSDIQSDSQAQPQVPKNATEILNNLDITNLNEGFESPTVSDTEEFEGSKYNILGLPINDSGEIKDINDLSESELEKLDDEALLLLQERALQDKSPKVLNKAQIDAINDILEDTQSAGDFGANNFSANNFGAGDFGTNNFGAQASGFGANNFGAQSSDFSMNNNEFQSLTQEALSEALDEGEIASNQNSQILEQDFGTQGFTKDYVADSFTQDFATDNFTQDFGDFQNEAPIAESSAQNFTNPTQTPQSQQTIQNIQSTPTKQISINDNLDLAEIIKTFPIDKLRELLSGVQITINITFPTKK